MALLFLPYDLALIRNRPVMAPWRTYGRDKETAFGNCPDAEPEKAAAGCDTNASMAAQLTAALAGEQFKASIVGNNLVVVPKKAGGETYGFTGNTEIMGNWSGGPGYGGLSGFVVRPKKPDAGHL